MRHAISQYVKHASFIVINSNILCVALYYKISIIRNITLTVCKTQQTEAGYYRANIGEYYPPNSYRINERAGKQNVTITGDLNCNLLSVEEIHKLRNLKT